MGKSNYVYTLRLETSLNINVYAESHFPHSLVNPLLHKLVFKHDVFMT